MIRDFKTLSAHSSLPLMMMEISAACPCTHCGKLDAADDISAESPYLAQIQYKDIKSGMVYTNIKVSDWIREQKLYSETSGRVRAD